MVLAVVTGANRGIGLGIVQTLVKHSQYHPLILYATSRSASPEDFNLAPSKDVQIIYPKLDISDPHSIQSLIERIRSKQDGGHGTVDVLINNAGIMSKHSSKYEEAKQVMDVNYWASLRMCQAFVPVMAEGGRIVNLSSIAGLLGRNSKEIQARFRDPEMTLEKLDGLANEYLASVKRGTQIEDGWASKECAYSISKSCMTAFTAILSRQHPELLINCCCPGWVATEMGNSVGKAPKTIEQAALIPLHIAFDDIQGVTGRYWANDKVGDTGHGKLQTW